MWNKLKPTATQLCVLGYLTIIFHKCSHINHMHLSLSRGLWNEIILYKLCSQEVNCISLIVWKEITFHSIKTTPIYSESSLYTLTILLFIIGSPFSYFTLCWFVLFFYFSDSNCNPRGIETNLTQDYNLHALLYITFSCPCTILCGFPL